MTHRDIVFARGAARAMAAALRFPAAAAAFIATTVSEIARTLLARAPFGEISIRPVREIDRRGVVLVACGRLVDDSRSPRTAMAERPSRQPGGNDGEEERDDGYPCRDC